MAPDTDAVTTSWGKMPLYELDWGGGLGRCERLRLPKEVFVSGSVIVLPPLLDGGLEIPVDLPGNAMERLRDSEGFTEFAKWSR